MSAPATAVRNPAKLYVVAHTHQAFKQWCYANNVPMDGNAIYVSNPHHLQGLVLSPQQVRFAPGWLQRANARDIEREAHHAMSKMSRK